jgi:hypothetical protein
MKATAVPVGQSWMWTLAFEHHEDRASTHGYVAAREAAMTVLELSGTTIRIVELRPGSTTMKSATLRCNQLLLKAATRFLVDCKTHDLARAISVPETEAWNAALQCTRISLSSQSS